jgi:ribosome maturation factor RimP
MNKDEFKNIIEPVVNRNNCILWGIEILRGKKRNTLRIFIDSNDTVDINDCENISRDLGYEPMLDISLGDDYVLEVSSPGVDRKFFDIGQLYNFLGEELELRTRELVDGRRKFSGILSKCDQKYFYLKDHNKEDLTKFKFTELDICKLKPNYNNLIKEHSHAK